jgi:hypothetical protein
MAVRRQPISRASFPGMADLLSSRRILVLDTQRLPVCLELGAISFAIVICEVHLNCSSRGCRLLFSILRHAIGEYLSAVTTLPSERPG